LFAFSHFIVFPLFFTILILYFLLYSINSYSPDDDLDNKFQLEYFALPSERTSGAILVIPQKALQNGTIFPLTLGNLSSGAAIILPPDMLERGAILPLYLNKSTDAIYPKNFSNNSIIVVPEKMLSGGIIDIKKGNMSSGAAIILPQDALDEGAVLSFKKGNFPKGLLLILTKEVLNNRQIVHLPQGGAILPITDANVSQGAIIFSPSQIVEDRVIPLPQEGTILPITDANITDGAIIMLSNKSLDQGGLFQLHKGLDIRSFLHGDNLLSMPERGPIIPPPKKDLKEVDLIKYFDPILIPDNSFFVPKHGAPIYLPNNSLLIENSTEIPTTLKDNSIFIPNEGPISIVNNSMLAVKSNYSTPINLPNGSLIGINGEILIPLPKVSLILNDTGTPIPVSEDDSLSVGESEKPLILPPKPGVSNDEESDKPVIPPPIDDTGKPVIPPPIDDTGKPVIPPPIDDTGKPVIPPPNVSILIGNDTDASPIPLPNKVSLFIGNDTDASPIPLPHEFSLLIGNDIEIINSNKGWFLILPNSLGTIIIPSDRQILKNLPQGTIIIPKDEREKIKNLSEGTIIIPKDPEKILPQGTTTTATIILPQGTTTTATPTTTNVTTPTTTNVTTPTTTNVTTPTTKEFNIAVAGDWGCTPDTKETFKNIQNKNPELIIGTGDLSYDDDGQCWTRIIEPLSTKTKIAFGDHDYKYVGDDRASKQQIAFGDDDYVEEDRVPQQYLLKYFNLKKTYYSFNHQNVHFLIMDPYVNSKIDSKQFKFVQDDLRSASLDSNIDWIFVIEHHPVYTSPSSHPGDSSIRDIYHPLFDLYNVDLVMSGDNHNYQRTFPLKYNATDPSYPLITNTDKYYYDDFEGEIYLITGTGGQKKYPLTGKEKYVVEQEDDDFGFLNLNIIGNKLEGIFYSNSYSANNYFIDKESNYYTIKDKFSISKNN
jgi:hypothetical protein